jgi:hypothetical protein
MQTLVFCAQIIGLGIMFVLATFGILIAIAYSRPQPWAPEMPDRE